MHTRISLCGSKQILCKAVSYEILTHPTLSSKHRNTLSSNRVFQPQVKLLAGVITTTRNLNFSADDFGSYFVGSNNFASYYYCQRSIYIGRGKTLKIDKSPVSQRAAINAAITDRPAASWKTLHQPLLLTRVFAISLVMIS